MVEAGGKGCEVAAAAADSSGFEASVSAAVPWGWGFAAAAVGLLGSESI